MPWPSTAVPTGLHVLVVLNTTGVVEPAGNFRICAAVLFATKTLPAGSTVSPRPELNEVLMVFRSVTDWYTATGVKPTPPRKAEAIEPAPLTVRSTAPRRDPEACGLNCTTTVQLAPATIGAPGQVLPDPSVKSYPVRPWVTTVGVPSVPEALEVSVNATVMLTGAPGPTEPKLR